MKVNSFAVLLFLIASSAFAQITETDYKRAESFLQFNIDKKLYYKSVEPNWSENTDWFSYMATTPKGKEFFKVNTAKKQKSACFDVQKLTTAINNFTKKTYETTSLPFSNVTVVDEFSVKFNIDSTEFVFNSKQNLLTRKPIEKVLNSKELKTPDGKNIVYIENGNIFLRNIATCAKTQISFDGTPENGYGHNLDWYATTNDSKGEKNDYSIEVYFSADSSKIIIPRFNREKTRRLQLYKSSVEGSYQSEIISYERSLAGDTNLTTVCYYIYDIAANKLIKTELEEAPAFLGTYVYTPAKSKKSYRIVYSRGYKKRDLIEIDNQIGKTKLLLSEENKKTYVDLYTEQFEANTETNEFIWASEQSGWNQLYLYDLQTGKLKNTISSGEFYVYEINKVDFKKRKIWFTAGGREKGFDPYFKLIYSVNFDGSKLSLLTPENASHTINVSPDGKFFVDNYSTYNQPVKSVLRSMETGKVVMEIENQDISELLKMGWRVPEPFVTKASDGKTDIYGLIYKPSNFDSTKVYPIIDGTYSGPHTIRTPKTFSRSVLNMDLALAELGFIVVTVDGLGSAFRSKALHDVSYARLGYGLTDHVKAIKELGKRHKYIDTTRVGIYGHSAGGYDATRALLEFPDFYKVGVSSAADHDHRMEKEWWPELYQGFPVDTQYHNQSNVTNAHKLQGKLMIVTGDLDNNVNPSATYKLAGELVKANKDFELIILPNDDHSSAYWNKHFIRKRWDFFVKQLAGQTHPIQYKIQ